jgi:hypothetical protein
MPGWSFLSSRDLNWRYRIQLFRGRGMWPGLSSGSMMLVGGCVSLGSDKSSPCQNWCFWIHACMQLTYRT